MAPAPPTPVGNVAFRDTTAEAWLCSIAVAAAMVNENVPCINSCSLGLEWELGLGLTLGLSLRREGRVRIHPMHKLLHLVIRRVFDSYLTVIWQLFYGYLTGICRLFVGYLSAICLLFFGYLTGVSGVGVIVRWRLFDDYLMWQLCDGYLTAIWRLFDGYFDGEKITAIWRLFDGYLTGILTSILTTT